MTEPTTWEHLQQEVATPESLEHIFGYWDAHVRRAYTPENQSFLLRYYLETSESTRKLYASRYSIYLSDFDLTGPPTLISEIASKLLARDITQIAITAPVPYFLPRGTAAWDSDFWREHLKKYRRNERDRRSF
ncbi:hypothetical protein [Armatimonas sp.]|uniref:hypothetical protein n=1 Tax=Armatimonas sp. TaxID=1872638 RepID=UPI00374C9CD9